MPCAGEGLFDEALQSGLVAALREQWLAQAGQSRASAFQTEVSRALSRVGIAHDMERLTDDGLFCIDIVLRGPARVAVEVDGPSHFLRNTRAPNGPTLARQRLLEARGWRVASVPWFEWAECHGDAAAQEACVQRCVLDGRVPDTAKDQSGAQG